MDEKNLEQAEELAASMIASGIARAGIKKKRPEDFEGICPDCAIEEVPEERVALGYYNCVACQSKEEARGRFYAR